jgi:guanylate kinase
LEIDWQGAAQVREVYPLAISIFILPPSIAALAERLNHRGQDSTEVIAARVAAAREEMRHLVEFDYVTINDKFDDALQDLKAIVRTQRLKMQVQVERNQRLIQNLT